MRAICLITPLVRELMDDIIEFNEMRTSKDNANSNGKGTKL